MFFYRIDFGFLFTLSNILNVYIKFELIFFCCLPSRFLSNARSCQTPRNAELKPISITVKNTGNPRLLPRNPAFFDKNKKKSTSLDRQSGDIGKVKTRYTPFPLSSAIPRGWGRSNQWLVHYFTKWMICYTYLINI